MERNGATLPFKIRTYDRKVRGAVVILIIFIIKLKFMFYVNKWFDYF
jgi:hypothetical protein